MGLLQMAEMTEEEADEIFKCTNCLLCRYPKFHAKNHHMTKCPFLKKNDTLDTEDDKKAATIDKKNAKKKKDAALKEQAEAEAAGMNTVGADGKDTKTPSATGDAIQNNLDSQSSKPAGSGRAAGAMGCFQS